MAVAALAVMAEEKRILIAYGSKRGGTAEIALAIGEVLSERGFHVDCMRADQANDPNDYDAVIVGGALYMFRWHRAARRFVAANVPSLRARPTWLFSSGPLDASASSKTIPPVRRVAKLLERIGARGHETFGGRLLPDAHGFPASSMARTHSGDWRDWDQIRAWAKSIGDQVRAEPGPRREIVLPARWPLAAPALLVGITAIAGGLALLWQPDGALLQMPISYLAKSPFSDFTIPGLLLFLVIGLGSLFTGLLALWRSYFAELAGLIAGSALLAWITTEMLMLRTHNALQIGTLALAVMILGESLRRLIRFDPGPAPFGAT